MPLPNMRLKNSLGLESGAVRVVAYDPNWPALFLDEATRLREACPLPLRLEHIGSTAVPNLCAKPVLDILAGHPETTDALDYVTAFERVGYVHRGEQGIPGRQFFRRGQPRAYHVHLVMERGLLWRRHLAFRDYLRRDTDAARRYAELKQDLARRFPHDREAYIEGKAAFIGEILRLADGAA